MQSCCGVASESRWKGPDLRLFRWLPARAIPPSLDLRHLGWEVVEGNAANDSSCPCPALAQGDALRESLWSGFGEWAYPPLRRLLLIGIDDHDDRARLLKLGFGDVTGSAISLREIEARALRVASQATSLQRIRQFVRLRLDLFARDGFAGDRPLGLHPREFALIWRLCDTPGQAVSKKTLIRDVWRMAHVPEPTSLAVHVYRLRAKLALASLDWMVQTTLGGGYLFETGAEARPVSPLTFSANQEHDDSASLALSVIQSLPRDPPS